MIETSEKINSSKIIQNRDPIFKRRWPIILAFFVFSANHSFQSVAFLPISQIVAEYYHVRYIPGLSHKASADHHCSFFLLFVHHSLVRFLNRAEPFDLESVNFSPWIRVSAKRIFAADTVRHGDYPFSKAKLMLDRLKTKRHSTLLPNIVKKHKTFTWQRTVNF